jgi:glyoxylate carboligase
VAERKASDLFVECLEAEGVSYVFGIPGEETLDLNESLEDSSITFVPVRHEQGGAYMADMYGRLTRRAGVCLGTLGPGATNLITGVADAFLDRSSRSPARPTSSGCTRSRTSTSTSSRCSGRSRSGTCGCIPRA